MRLSLGFSPCPNDTFIFDAMINGKIDTEGLEFEVIMADVEELNRAAFKSEPDITKLSYHAYAHLTKDYILLNSGSALGNNCGPLLIASKKHDIQNLSALSVAIPGRYTTANFLLSFAFPQLKNKTEILFSEIENMVLSSKIDLGVIIHENRFTYHERGLICLMDLGKNWEEKTGLPIPLGGIVCRRNFEKSLQLKIDRVLKRSIEFAFANPESSKEFVSCHAQEMSEDVMQKHINLYVNHYTLDLGKKGIKAIETMFSHLESELENSLVQPLVLS
jgi:1,4-dihydroxy-6-naphthoate synthase